MLGAEADPRLIPIPDQNIADNRRVYVEPIDLTKICGYTGQDKIKYPVNNLPERQESNCPNYFCHPPVTEYCCPPRETEPNKSASICNINTCRNIFCPYQKTENITVCQKRCNETYKREDGKAPEYINSSEIIGCFCQPPTIEVDSSGKPIVRHCVCSDVTKTCTTQCSTNGTLCLCPQFNKPLKSILRNPVHKCECYHDIQDSSKTRQVSFEVPYSSYPSNTVTNASTPPVISLTNCHSNQRTDFCSNYPNQECRQDINVPAAVNLSYPHNNLAQIYPLRTNEQRPFHYLHVNSQSIPEERSQPSYTNNPSHHNTIYECPKYTPSQCHMFVNPQQTQQHYPDLKNLNDYLSHNQEIKSHIPCGSNPQTYPLLNQLPAQDIGSPGTHSPQYNLPSSRDCLEGNANTGKSPFGRFGSYLSPRACQKETILLGRNAGPFAIPVNPGSYCAQCYGQAPRDLAYFHREKFEVRANET